MEPGERLVLAYEDAGALNTSAAYVAAREK